jgi:hypothetical protein
MRVNKDVHVAAKVAADEQTLVRIAWDAEAESRLDALDLAAERHEEGWPVVTLDEQNRVVLHHPDGSIEQR